MRPLVVSGVLALLAAGLAAAVAAEPVGQFTDHRDIGNPGLPGASAFDPATHTYRVSGGGGNMWDGRDSFQLVWKRMTGDVAISTALDFVSPMPAPTAGGYVHRKGGVIIRQDLDPDSVYVDALRMGNHQLSLQYRAVKGGPTRLIWINTGRQQSVMLEKVGDYAYLSVPGPDGRLRAAGGSFKLRITGPYLIGLAVCAHDNGARETLDFRDVRIAPLAHRRAAARGMTLETMQVANALEQTALYHAAAPIAISGWSPDGKSVVFASGGARYRALAWDSDVVERLKAGDGGAARAAPPFPGSIFAAAASGSRGAIWRARANGSGRTRVATGDGSAFAPRLSPDGKWLAYLATDDARAAIAPGADLALRLMPVVDGEPQPDKAITLSQFRGGPASLGAAAWSPDSRTVAFVAYD